MTDYSTQSSANQRSGQNNQGTNWVPYGGTIRPAATVNTTVGPANVSLALFGTGKATTSTPSVLSSFKNTSVSASPVSLSKVTSVNTTTLSGIKVASKAVIPYSPTAADKAAGINYSAAPKTYQSSGVNTNTLKGILEASFGTPPPTPPSNPAEYKWNLPPHKWSLPVFPSTDKNFMPKGGQARKPPLDSYRRGRIWWKASDSNVQLVTTNGKTALMTTGAFKKYGFQFLWNPESFSTQVAVQMDATPNSNDRFLGTVGAFPATETVTFNIRLDRTNDFACAAGSFGRPTQVKLVKPGSITTDWISKAEVRKYVSFYKREGTFANSDSADQIEAKLVDLFQRGTIADLEFLFRAINGPGPGGGDTAKDLWVNGRGTATADIGFLMPTLLNIDIGPLSYQGYVTNLSVTHGAFTQEMIPIRTDVTISLNLLATAGLSSAYAESNK